MVASFSLGNLGLPSGGIGELPSRTPTPAQPASSAPLSDAEIEHLLSRKKSLESQLVRVAERAKSGKKISDSMKKWVGEARAALEKINAKLGGASAPSGTGGYVAGPNPAQSLAGVLGPQSQFRPGYSVQGGGTGGAATPDAAWNRQTGSLFEAASLHPTSIAALRNRLMNGV